MGGVLESPGSAGNAYKGATAHCATFNKRALITNINEDNATFECR